MILLSFLEEVGKFLLNGIDIVPFTGYFIIGMFGTIVGRFSLIFQHREKIKEYGGFSFKKWQKENMLYLIFGFLILPPIILYGVDIDNEDSGLTHQGVFIISFSLDTLIERLTKRTK